MSDETTPVAANEPQQQDARPAPSSRKESEDEEIRRISEHIRRTQLESEARILARWKKRGLFGLTTSVD